MISVIEYMYKRGINFSYEYQDRNNIITIETNNNLNDVQKNELIDICERDGIIVKDDWATIILEFTPYGD